AAATADQALTAVSRYLDRCKLAANTVKAYRRQATAYITWLNQHTCDHPDAFTDIGGAEAAVTAWRRHLLRTTKASPSSVNQALAAVTLLYEHGARLRIQVKRARVRKPGEPDEPDALTPKQQARVERAAARRGPRDTAIISVLLYAGPRVEECARLDAAEQPLIAGRSVRAQPRADIHGEHDPTVDGTGQRETGQHPAQPPGGDPATGQRVVHRAVPATVLSHQGQLR
ncbi:hypothetical protein F3J25_21520, partial [Enterobacter sp. Cy-1797]